MCEPHWLPTFTLVPPGSLQDRSRSVARSIAVEESLLKHPGLMNIH